MDFHLKQWRNQSEEEKHQEESPPKLPKLSSALPLFVPEPTTTLSPISSHNTSTAKFPRMGSYFSLAQWQELELQALIFRYMISGAAVPHELLLHVKKSLISSSPYYICNPLHQYYSQYQPSLLQSGYWGRGVVDPEPGRCRRTDGKKWRCSRDVVAGQKYCERHMHRGRNRSRKPVEIPTSTTGAAAYGGNGGGDALKTSHSTSQGTANGGLSGHLSSSVDLLHLNGRLLDSTNEIKHPFEAPNDGQSNGDRTLRHFFHDWPKSLQETDDATNLSISMPENPSSDFLKLGTGDGDEFSAQIHSGERERTQPSWGMTWDANRVAPMGGPLAEALRLSTTTSSPTSVLHRLTRSSASEASFVSS